MASVLPAFNSERVLRDYLRDFYVPAARQGRAMAVDGFKAARELGAWKEKVRAAWPGVGLKLHQHVGRGHLVRASASTLEVEVTLNGLAPRDVRVECQRPPCARLGAHRAGARLCGKPQAHERRRAYLEGASRAASSGSRPGSADGAGVCRYRLEFQPPWAGTSEYEVRAVPDHANLSHPYELGLMRRL